MCESECAAAVPERPAGATAAAAEVAGEAGEGRRRVRHRKKLLYERILKQMEFYFSDANLAKDRFLAQLLARGDGAGVAAEQAGAGAGEVEVPLDTFLTFNKIRALTHDTADIAKAMKHSSLLQLSQDRTKVSRKTPIQTYDADSRTVYVESIPASANREWLERVFGDYGQVTYVSLPRYKNSQRIKGYGFIEYAKPEEVKNCLNTFTEMGCKLPTCMPPEELSSIKTFSLEGSDTGDPAPEGEPPKKRTKKKKSKSSDHDSDDSGLRREDTSVEEDNTPKIEVKSAVESEAADESDSEAQRGGGGSGGGGEGAGAGEEGKRKKRRRKRGGGGEGEQKPGAEQDAGRAALWGLQVLAKAEWKALRNKYLNLQRDRLKQWRRRAREHPAPPPPHYQPAAPDSPCGGGGGGTEPAAAAPAEAEAAAAAGVFVAASLPAPCRDVAATKRQLGGGGGGAAVRHVEVREGQSEAVLRFDSLDAANEWASGWAQADARAARWRVLAPAEQRAHAQRWRRARDKRRQPGGSAAAASHIRFEEDAPPPPPPYAS